ncbi:GNAT family N-acetyltransferase [Halalkalicoccus tibetensis]|uniref:GNAT family N-acetyltransferase n=1 Tax=Halalkalicoccus tibetensis TaxID=175632 RepID=A0ABD5V4H4_9EURY
MYVRRAKNREEAWLRDGIERMGLDGAAFRPEEYVVALDEETGRKAGFGRLRLHDEAPEITSLGVVESWRGQGVGAHVVERLVGYAGDEGFESVHALAPEPDYLLQFGFEPVERSALPAALAERLDAKREDGDEVIAMTLPVGEFSMPERLRERFKEAAPATEVAEAGESLPPEEFGIDPDSATYKYDTGG